MEEKINAVRADLAQYNGSDAEEFKRLFTGKKGVISTLFEDFKELPGPEKGRFGKLLNELKNEATAKFTELQAGSAPKRAANAPDDLTLPGDAHFIGTRHPLSIIQNRIISIFEKIGFVIADGPEIEDDWHNFTALNMPEDHPARDMQDTFFVHINPDLVLRTHTSSVQIRTMQREQPPIRILSPGRVYRNETISARAHCFFHQIEGLYIDEKVSFADLLQTLDFFVKELFGKEAKATVNPDEAVAVGASLQ